ncbi:YqgE/AlgH family protein [Herminiimonas sp. CN]|uniref:YqgE/AlgH family protein n=1 Tax=Herminiimonas sp. CN TaxID=1349818 RepID=UPI0018724F0E
MQVSPGSSQVSSDLSGDAGAMTLNALNLANHFLIAMPSMADPVFSGTVVYLCEHNSQGALGMVINKPTDMCIDDLLDRVELQGEKSPDYLALAERPVMFGGQVQEDRGFVLHTPGDAYSSTLKVTEQIAFTTSRDILEAIATGKGPSRFLISVGYSGWSAGQLESEIAANAWLTVEADPAVLFDLPLEQRYKAAIRLLGIDPLMLAAEAGHA